MFWQNYGRLVPMSYHYWLVNRFWRQNDRALTQIAFRQRPTPASIEWLSQKPGIHDTFYERSTQHSQAHLSIIDILVQKRGFGRQQPPPFMYQQK